MIVSWEDWSIYPSPPPDGGVPSISTSLNFQVVLSANGNVEYRYGSMSGAGAIGATTGAQRAQGSSATTWIDIGPAASPININSGTAPGIQPNTAYFYQLALNR